MAIMSKAEYVIEGGEIKIKAVHDGKLVSIPTNMRPYYFVKVQHKGTVEKLRETAYVEETDLKYRDAKGREWRVVKVECRKPSDVASARETLRKWGIETYEADIVYVRRCLIDDIFEVDYGGSVCYIDIELDDSKGFPSEKGKYKILSIAAYDQRGGGEWFYVGDYDTEKQMLDAFVSYLMSESKTVLVGWNVKFDYDHIFERCKNLGVKYEWLKYCIPYDLKIKYENTVKGLESYSLEEVTLYEGMKHKSRSKKVSEMTREELEEYNMYDAEACRIIDEEYGFTELDIEVAKEVNLTLDDLRPVAMGDALVIRRLRELGYVARNVGDTSKKGYKGAYVKMPKPGVHEGVVYLDFTAMYPMIIIYKKIDIDGFSGEVMPIILQRLVEKRKEYKQKYKETGERKWDIKQSAMKPIINCFSDDTYIVTLDGIKLVKDVKVGDKVFSVNPETLEVEIDEIVATWEYDYEGDMYMFKNKRYLDLLVTPEHRFLTRTSGGNIVWATAEEIYKLHRWIPSPKPMRRLGSNSKYISLLGYAKECVKEYGFEYECCIGYDGHLRSLFTKLSKETQEKIRKYGRRNDNDRTYRVSVEYMNEKDILDIIGKGGKVWIKRKGIGKASKIPAIVDKIEFAKLIGWYVAEGHIDVIREKEYEKTRRGRSYRIVISQHKEENRKRIVEICGKLGIHCSVTHNGVVISNDILAQYLKRECGKGAENKKVPEWILYDTYEVKKAFLESLYAGDGNEKQTRYSTKSKRLLNDLVRLLTSMGYWIKYYQDSDCYRIVWYKCDAKLDKRITKEKIHYKGKIYCVTTKKNHTVFAGRNGKFVLTGQSMYGLFGNRYWRYKNEKKAELVTSSGWELVKKLEKIVSELFGMEVIYADTDSAFVKVVGVKDVVAFAKILEDAVNEELKPFEVKVEEVFDSIIFLKKEGKEEEGVKKRYIGITVDGEWVWRGVEKRRSDWCKLAKEVQEEVAKMVLVEKKSREEVLQYLSKIKKRMFAGEFDEKLVIAKGFRDLNSYKANQPHIRALKKALSLGYVPVDGKIKFVWVAGKDVEPIITDGDLGKWRGKLNYRYYWESQVYPPVRRILESVSGGVQRKLF